MSLWGTQFNPTQRQIQRRVENKAQAWPTAKAALEALERASHLAGSLHGHGERAKRAKRARRWLLASQEDWPIMSNSSVPHSKLKS